MGLENHIVNVIEENKEDFVVVHGEHFWFEDGLRVAGPRTAEIIMSILDESGEFGPTRYNADAEKSSLVLHSSFSRAHM